jgi:hypothetical protein
MVQTIFAADYLEEKFNTYIDNLNMVYVAFTRAVSVLMVNAPYKDTKKINSVSDLLYASLTELSVSNNWQGTQNEAEKSFELGSLFQNNKRKKKSKGEQFITTKYFFNEFNSRLKLRTDSDDFFEETGMSNKNLGKLLHEILAEVTTFDDVENACQKALGQRKITNDEFEKLFEWLTELVNSAHAKDWFSGGYKVLNERNLLSGNGIKRPDRILIKGNKAIVIDYKLGDAELDKYKRQVKDYAFELKKIGFSEVDGFLWYLKPNKIQKVCSL